MGGPLFVRFWEKTELSKQDSNNQNIKVGDFRFRMQVCYTYMYERERERERIFFPTVMRNRKGNANLSMVFCEKLKPQETRGFLNVAYTCTLQPYPCWLNCHHILLPMHHHAHFFFLLEKDNKEKKPNTKLWLLLPTTFTLLFSGLFEVDLSLQRDRERDEKKAWCCVAHLCSRDSPRSWHLTVNYRECSA